MPQGTKCAFLSGLEDPTCWKGDCHFWITYTKHGKASEGECTFRLLALMGFPNFGANLEEDVD